MKLLVFDTSGITHVGSYDAPVAEQIFALKPDLIVGAFEDEDGTYGKLALYAGFELFGRSVADALMDFAEVVGKTEAATELRNKYDERIQTLKGKIAGRHPDLTVTFASTLEPGVAIVQDSGRRWAPLPTTWILAGLQLRARSTGLAATSRTTRFSSASKTWGRRLTPT